MNKFMTRDVKLRRLFVVALASAAVVAVDGPCMSQEPTETTAADPPAEAMAIFRAPLLREGSRIIEARATLKRDEARSGGTTGNWTLVIDQPDASAPAHAFRLLPCTRFSEMLRIVNAAPDHKVVFQVTGPVFVFRKDNYLLPSHATVLMEQETTPPPMPSPAAAAAQPQEVAQSTEIEPQNAPTSDSTGDSADDIMRDLEQVAGPLARNPTAVGASLPASANEPTSSPNDTTDTASGISGRAGKLLPEEASIVDRRGKIMRDAQGGWMFVFDADTSGLADPPMRLLPCMLLERIEDYARRQGSNSPALLSGVVYIYAGQNYLLPTVFRIPQERRNITP